VTALQAKTLLTPNILPTANTLCGRYRACRYRITSPTKSEPVLASTRSRRRSPMPVLGTMLPQQEHDPALADCIRVRNPKNSLDGKSAGLTRILRHCMKLPPKFRLFLRGKGPSMCPSRVLIMPCMYDMTICRSQTRPRQNRRTKFRRFAPGFASASMHLLAALLHSHSNRG
jgi:hypothetical protein